MMGCRLRGGERLRVAEDAAGDLVARREVELREADDAGGQPEHPRGDEREEEQHDVELWRWRGADLRGARLVGGGMGRGQRWCNPEVAESSAGSSGAGQPGAGPLDRARAQRTLFGQLPLMSTRTKR